MTRYTKDEIQLYYEDFKLQWMIDHGYTFEDLVHSFASYMEDCEEDIVTGFDLWEQDCGFNGAIWPCFNEWLECEGAQYAHDWNTNNHKEDN